MGTIAQQRFESADITPPFEQAWSIGLAVLAPAGGQAHHICRMTAHYCDKPACLAARKQLDAIWRALMGKHFPAMSMIFVADLLDNPGKIHWRRLRCCPWLDAAWRSHPCHAAG